MWGAGVITSRAGRGAIHEDHLQCIGNFAYNLAIRDYLASLGSGRLRLIEIDMDEIGPYRIPFAGYALSNVRMFSLN